MFTFMAKFKRDQKIIIFSHSLALTIFQPRGPVGLAEGAGLTSSIGLFTVCTLIPSAHSSESAFHLKEQYLFQTCYMPLLIRIASAFTKMLSYLYSFKKFTC